MRRGITKRPTPWGAYLPRVTATGSMRNLDTRNRRHRGYPKHKINIDHTHKKRGPYSRLHDEECVLEGKARPSLLVVHTDLNEMGAKNEEMTLARPERVKQVPSRVDWGKYACTVCAPMRQTTNTSPKWQPQALQEKKEGHARSGRLTMIDRSMHCGLVRQTTRPGGRVTRDALRMPIHNGTIMVSITETPFATTFKTTTLETRKTTPVV